MSSSLSGPFRRKTIRVQDGAGASHTTTLEHLKRGWIPVNPRILSEARLLLINSPENRSDLYSLISNDLSLCLHLNSELSRQSGNDRHGDPAQRIARATSDELLRALPLRGSEISRHDIRKISPSQSGQLQRTLIAQKTARMVAERAGMRGNDAEFGALFADLGRQLVAWNYPTIFSRALSLQKTGSGDLDLEIERMLGLDPRKIASQLAPQFGLSQELQIALARLAGRAAMAEPAGPADYSDILSYARSYSEHLDSKHFSANEGKFLEIERKMRERIGSLPSTQEIEEQLADTLSLYQQVVSPQQRLALSGWQKLVVPSGSGPVTLDALRIRIPESISNMVSELIRTIDGAGDTVRALSSLVEEVIPGAGFSSGCVYLLSKDKQLLVPQIWIGERDRAFSSIIPISSGDALAQALFSSMPVKQTVTHRSGKSSSIRFTAGFQSPRVDGVIILCSANINQNQQQEYDQLVCFRSIHALLEMILRKDSELHDPH